ncbi:MAG: glycogen/starch synthase [Candidatus Omnitrophota bacterium]
MDNALREMRFMTVAFTIADHFLKWEGRAEGLRAWLEDIFIDNFRFLEDQKIDLGGVTLEGGTVSIPFEKDDIKKIAKICKSEDIRRPGDKEEEQKAAASGWDIAGEYAITVTDNKGPHAPGQRDLKGPEALPTDPVIANHIKSGRVVEVYLDGETDSLMANKVKWLKNYVPMVTPREMWLGQWMDINQLFTRDEASNLEKWIRANSVRGSPVKFRVLLGSGALGWQDDMEHSNISHAGLRDAAVYIGGSLLKYLFREGNEEQRREILDNDELRHLRGLDHGTEEEYRRRLDSIRPVVEELERIKRMAEERDVKSIQRRIMGFLEAGDEEGMMRFISILNGISLSHWQYPVESRYPVKHAVALLTKEEQDKLERILKCPRFAEYQDRVLVDDILLMLNGVEKTEGWVEEHAPELVGRSLWQISPEIWHEAGGLARVMQYHGAAMKELIGKSDVRFRQLEPQYNYRIDADGEAKYLDYTSDITHPVRELEEVDRFTVTVGGKEINVVVNRGINDLGIEVFMLRDVTAKGDSYYMHSLYNYRNPWDHEIELPTWEEFSVFYSKASLEFIRRYEGKEKERIESSGEEWKAPVVHTNDSQTALVSVYRKILADNQRETGDGIDRVLDEMTVFFTTHTYANRREYFVGSGVGDKVLNFMEVPYKYRELFKHYIKGSWGKYVYDMASGGLRSADGQGAVARRHRDDMAMFDEWVNFVEALDLEQVFRELEVSVELVGISNGDRRRNSAEIFRNALKKLYGDDMDIEHVTAEQVYNAKRLAKEELRLSPRQVYYSSHEKPEAGARLLDPGQPVISYSGRLVNEKAGRERAFIDENIEALVARGVQVLIYGNLQTNNESSETLARGLIALTEKLKAHNYPGKLIFVPRFSLKDQRALLAATDIQVQDSHGFSEAAGYTEADISACGGLELPPPREGIGEGLMTVQGMPINFDVPGEGNTLTPANWTPGAYLDIMNRTLDLGLEGLSHYQATSVRLSRALKSTLTGGQYLREFNTAVRKKKAKLDAREKYEEMLKMEERDLTLLGQVESPDPVKEPGEYLVYETCRLVMDGREDEAINLLFTDKSFQGLGKNLGLVAEMINKFIKVYSEDRTRGTDIKAFLNRLDEGIFVFSGSDHDSLNVARSVQLMTGQGETIISWISAGVKGAEGIRLAAGDGKMARNVKEKRRSFVDTETLPEGAKEVKEEGGPGFFWRGVESLGKLGKSGENILKPLIFDQKFFNSKSPGYLMYIMDHGVTEVPGAIKEATEGGLVSTYHETYFVHDRLPGSRQFTSTGAGHFQWRSLDIKYVTEGKGIQFNVLYSADGKVLEVIAQEIKAGEWCLALPGYKNYMVNLGGLRFNDMSTVLTPEEAKMFNDKVDFNDAEEVLRIKEAAGSAKYAPYGAGIIDGKPTAIKVDKNIPDAQWITNAREEFVNVPGKGNTLLGIYNNLTGERLSEMVGGFAGVIKKRHVFGEACPSNMELKPIDAVEKDIEPAGGDRMRDASLGGRENMEAFIEDNLDFLSEVLGPAAENDKLIRVAVESIESVGIDNIKDFLAAIQGTPRGYVELYSTSDPLGVSENAYGRYGITRKELPDGFLKNRSNTVSVFPVFKGEELPESGKNRRWHLGGIPVTDTIVSPIGYNYDRAGIIRSVFLGLRLSEIARNEDYVKDSNFVSYTLAQYMALCVSQGQEPRDFDLSGDDLISIARGDMPAMISALNKLIRLLPIMPVNMEELKMIYERAREILIRA